MTTDQVKRLVWRGVGAGLLLGCRASDREAPEPSTMEIAKPAGNSGDEQVGVAGVRLPDSLRVVVTRDEQPVAGVTVIWFTTEGTVHPATGSTGPDGMAATTWTPLELYAEQFAMARVESDGGRLADMARLPVHHAGSLSLSLRDPRRPRWRRNVRHRHG